MGPPGDSTSDVHQKLVDSYTEIARLAGRHPSCILLSNAPCAMVTVEESA